MLLTSARKVPAMAFAWMLPPTGANVSTPSFSAIDTSSDMPRLSEPRGPFTEIASPSVTSTPFGNALGAGMTISHHTTRGGDNRDTQAIHDARKLFCTFVYAQTGLADTLDPLDHRTAGVILELQFEFGLAGLATDGEIIDIAFVLQNLGDRHFDLGRRHRAGCFFNRLCIANAGQHVRDGITHTHIVYPLPACLDDARDLAPHCIFTQLPARQAKLAEYTTRAAGQLAAVALAHRAGIAGQFLQRLVRSHAVFIAGLHIGDHSLKLGTLGGIFFHHARALFFTIDQG